MSLFIKLGIETPIPVLVHCTILWIWVYLYFEYEYFVLYTLLHTYGLYLIILWTMFSTLIYTCIMLKTVARRGPTDIRAARCNSFQLYWEYLWNLSRFVSIWSKVNFPFSASLLRELQNWMWHNNFCSMKSVPFAICSKVWIWDSCVSHETHSRSFLWLPCK